MLFRATKVAAEAHDGQFRKGTRVPYLVHPLRVAAILAHAGLDEVVVTAGILHDVVEDTQLTFADLNRWFPPDVCSLVESATEPDKSEPWELRKTRAIESVPGHSTDALCLICADKIDNLESLAEQLEHQGEAAWERFSRGREQQRWFYTSALHAISRAAAAGRGYDPGRSPVPGGGDGGRPVSAAECESRSNAEAGLERLIERLARAVERVFPNTVE